LVKEPIIIGVLGPIGVGKSTLSRILAEKLNTDCVEENFPQNPFLENFYKDPIKYSFLSQAYFLESTVSQLAGLNCDQSHLLDPANEMNFLYAQTHNDMGWMDFREFGLYETLYQTLTKRAGIKKPDLFLCINAKHPVLVERIKRRGRPYELLMLANYPRYLSNLSQRVESFTGANLLRIDASSDNFIDEIHVDGLLRKIGRNLDL